MTKETLQLYGSIIRQIESGNNYSANAKLDNKTGYALGAYQFLPSTLASTGLLKYKSGNEFNAHVNSVYKEKKQEMDSVCGRFNGGAAVSCRGKFVLATDPSVWRKGMDYNKFLSDKSAQDEAFASLTASNHASLQKSGKLTGDEKTDMQLLGSAHFAGVGNVISGKAIKDVLGTTTSYYSGKIGKLYDKRSFSPEKVGSTPDFEYTPSKETSSGGNFRPPKEVPADFSSDKVSNTPKDTPPAEASFSHPFFSDKQSLDDFSAAMGNFRSVMNKYGITLE